MRVYQTEKKIVKEADYFVYCFAYFIFDVFIRFCNESCYERGQQTSESLATL
jgi:hypothetical protein